MNLPKLWIRIFHIHLVLVRHQLDDIIFAAHLFRPLRFLFYFLPWCWFRGEPEPRAIRLRKALEELGPIYVKFGQILSTRQDILPDDIAFELSKLQDQVPSFPGFQAKQIIEKSLGQSVENAFAHFDETPLASASIAQVHTARLKTGEEVVVKVVRPGIEKQIHADIALLTEIAKLAERYWSDGKRLRPCEIVNEFRKTIFDELDLMREAANATALRRNFLHSGKLYVPEIHWELTRTNILVSERIHGIPVNQRDRLISEGIDLHKLAALGVEIFFTQVFRDNLFHADMHPGNIFVAKEGHYIAVDFGIMGSLSPNDQRYLAENFLAFFKRDYQKVAALHVECGWVPADTRIDEFEAAIRSVCEPIFEKPLKDISFGTLLLRLFQTARRFNMEVQPQLVLLQKTLLNIEGLGKQLYPDLNLWDTAKPFLEDWMQSQVGYRAFFRGMQEQLPKLSEYLPELPFLFFDVMKKAHEGNLKLEWKSEDLQKLRKEIRRGQQRTIYAIIGSGFVISASVLLGLDGYGPLMIGNAPLLTWIMAGTGITFLISAWPDK